MNPKIPINQTAEFLHPEIIWLFLAAECSFLAHSSF